MKTTDPTWHKEAVGGLWEEIGRLQFDFLVRHGLRPHHYLLDVGCGSLRGGIHFVSYLEPGHYFGIDKNKALLQAGKHELKTHRLSSKSPTLVEMEDFDFRSLDRTFDFALAQSVFTHLPLNSIIRCLVSIEKVLAQEGRFFATFSENPEGKFRLEPLQAPRSDGPAIVTFLDKDPYHYDLGTFQWICARTQLRVEYIGDWNHPRNQKMLLFTRIS